MCNSVVNVCSKQARFQDLGTIPSNAGDLKGWPITNHFLSFVNFEAGQRFLEKGEVSGPATNSIECRGPARVANHKDFLSIVNFHAGNLCPIMWSTFSRNMRGFKAWDQFHRIQGTCKGGQSHGILFLSLIFMLEIYVQFGGQRFLETGEVSGPGTNSFESRNR